MLGTEKKEIIRLERHATQPGTRRLPPVVGLLAGATAWGLVWYPLRLLEAAGLGGAAASFLVFLLALLFGLPFTWRGFAEFRRGTALLAGIGLAAGWANLAYVLGVIHGEVVRVLLLFYLAPLWTVILSRLLLDERLLPAGYGVIALSVAGAAVMLWHPEMGMPWPKNAAEWLGMSAGMAFAVSNVLSRRARALSVSAKSLSIWLGVVVVAVAVLVFQPPDWTRSAAAVLGDWPLLVGVGLVMCGITVAVQHGVSHTPANQAIVILLFELVVAAVAAWWLVDETLGAREWIGGAMIVAASLLSGHMEKGQG